MSANKTPYNLQYLTATKQRDSPTSSILKTPTPIFVTSRRSSARTKRLKFANGPDVLDNEINERREGSHDSASTTSTATTDISKSSYGGVSVEEKLIEVALSPVKKMKVSPESWNAFVEYQKYKDYSNETEKTDFTYSRLSKFRDKEIIPGYRIRPNLSRCPIYFNSSNKSSSITRSPESSYTFKRTTVYENSSSPRSKFEADTTLFDRSKLYQNETSEYSLHDGYFSDDSLRSGNEMRSHLRFSDDGGLMRNRKGYLHSTLRSDKQPHLGASFGIDETDDNFISSTQREEKSPYSSIQRVVIFLSAICTTIFSGITSTLTRFKDLFSRYILRRKTYPYSNYSSVSYRPWSQSNAYNTYSYGKYQTYNQGRFSSWWYQSFLYKLYSKVIADTSSLWQYVRTQYNRSSRKKKLLWLLIPLMLLLAFWLARAEEKEAYVSNKMSKLKCKAEQLIFQNRNVMGNAWKRIFGKGESFMGWLLMPLFHLAQLVSSLLAAGFYHAVTFLSSLLTGFFWVVDLFRNIIDDVLSRISAFLNNIFSEIIEQKDNISSGVYNFFSDIIFAVLNGLSFILGGLGSFAVDAFEYFKSMLPVSHESVVNVTPVSSDFAKLELRDERGYWEGLRKRVEYLEGELVRLKEEKTSGSVAYQKQLDDNYKALQKYQVKVNDALRRQSARPVQVSKSSIQYYLDNMSDELKKWIIAHFILKSESNGIDDDKFAFLMAKYSNRTGDELKSLQKEFSRFVRQYSAELNSLKTDLSTAHYQNLNANDLPLALIKRIVAEEIRLHDADKTGRVDFALRSAGGHVLSVKCTKSFNHCFRYSSIFGFNVCSYLRKNTPEEAISPGMAPGQCWAFAGSQGFLILELSHSIIVTGFTMEHISRLVSPNGRIESAPKKFSMWGLKTELDMDPYLFGEYEYKDNNETYQYFPVVNYSIHPYKIVELSIASNHGNPNYTCLYRIRVHGDIYPSHL